MFDRSLAAETAPRSTPATPALRFGGDGAVFDVSMSAGHVSLEARLLETVLSGAPGPELVALLTEVEAGPVASDDAVTVAQAWERVSRWVAARSSAAIARVVAQEEASRPGTSSEIDPASEEIRTALNLTVGQADRRTDLARQLSTRLPLTAAALEGGEVSLAHVMSLVDLLGGRSDDIAAAVEERVLRRAPHQAVPAFKRSVRRALMRIDPLGEALAHLEAAGMSDVVKYDDAATGQSTILATLPTVDAAILWNTLDACARRDRGRDGNRDQPAGDEPGPSSRKRLGAYRVDTLLRWAQQELADPDAPKPQRRPIELQVVIDLPTLMGLRDHPAEIPGHGPLPAPIARLLAEDAEWRRFISDPVTGHLLDYGRSTYAPPQELRDFVLARDRMCVAPRCDRSSRHAQLDHLDAFARADGRPAPRGDPPDTSGTAPPGTTRPRDPDSTTEGGGRTSAANLRPECTWHHLLKTHHGWRVEQRSDGLLWTSPGGRAYLVPPQPVLPE